MRRRRMDRPQLRTTADFGTGSLLLTWYTGGLNHQVIHHLFPKIAHVRYPIVRDVVEGFCREKGLPYHRYPSLLAAVRGHLRRLHSLGRPDHERDERASEAADGIVGSR